MWKAWPGLSLPAQAPPPPAFPASLTFALGSPAIERAPRGSAAPQHQLREEGAAAGGGAEVEAEPGAEVGWKAGPGKRGRLDRVLPRAPLSSSAPPTLTIEQV